MTKSNAKKSKQLGMPFGTACARLRKALMFSLVQQLGLDNCHRCGLRIGTVDTFSTDHKVPWLDSSNPRSYFFDVTNITFSHLSCNTSVARKPMKKYFTVASRLQADRVQNASYMRRSYTKRKRQKKYIETGW